MKKKVITLNILNYLLYIGLMLFHIYGNSIIELEGIWVYCSIGISSLMIIFYMFHLLDKYPGYKKLLYFSLTINFFNIVVYMPVMYLILLSFP